MTTSTNPLDNPVWHSLAGAHAGFAVGDGRARRYRADVSVFCAQTDVSARAWADLATIRDEHGVVVLFRADPIEAPDGWIESGRGRGYQMVLDGALRAVPELAEVDPHTGASVDCRALVDADVNDMVALVARTEPGPFAPRTIELGGYLGIFHDDRLVAMAGQRLRAGGHCEISAVCTDEAARRRGYASIVTARVAQAIHAQNEIPFLHVRTTNYGAIPVYERLGFAIRTELNFVALQVPAG